MRYWIAMIAVGAAAGIAWWLLRAEPPVAPPVEKLPPHVAVRPPPPPPAPAPVDPDALLRTLLATRPELSRWFPLDGLMKRAAAIVENLAEGASPRPHLAALEPRDRFRVVERDGRAFIDPASFRRYDTVAEVVAALDVRALAEAVRALRPALDAAYRALGYPGASIERALGRALGRIASARVPAGDIEVVPKGGVYAFADEKLEDLAPAEKHLIRMGAKNARKVQAKARALMRELGLGGS